MDEAAVAVTPCTAPTTPKNTVPMRVTEVLFMFPVDGIAPYPSPGPYWVLLALDRRLIIIHAVASSPPTADPAMIHASNDDMSNNWIAPQIAAPKTPPPAVPTKVFRKALFMPVL